MDEKRCAEIRGYEGEYIIYTDGRIYSVKNKRFLSPSMARNGYMQIKLTHCGLSKTFKIHRLVADAFIENPLNLPQVNHKDENKANNDVSNLEWCTREYNMNYLDGQKRRAKNRNYEEISRLRSNALSKEVTQYDYDGSIIAIWKSAAVAEKHGYNKATINQCCLGNKKSHKGYLWKYSNYAEKQIPKKPVFHDNCGNKCASRRCPSCFEIVGGKYCENCGQALDWSEE